MRKFIVAAFVMAFMFGYFFKGPGTYMVVPGAIGIATGLTVIGWMVARKAGYRWGAAGMTAFMALMVIGR